MSVSLAEFPISSVLITRGVLYFNTPFRHTYPELGVWNYWQSKRIQFYGACKCQWVSLNAVQDHRNIPEPEKHFCSRLISMVMYINAIWTRLLSGNMTTLGFGIRQNWRLRMVCGKFIILCTINSAINAIWIAGSSTNQSNPKRMTVICLNMLFLRGNN